MFLFTTNNPPSSPAPSSSSTGGNPVVDAIRQGAQASGTSFDYLLATAQRESSLDPTAKAPTSSASGLFQFIEQTWLGLVKSEGPRLGLSDYSNAITARSDGTLTVSDPGTRDAILKLREDPKIAATLAGTLAQKNSGTLSTEIGRQPNAGDLYVAHVLGAKGAADLIKTAQKTPTRTAALDFPEAAAANRGIFYDRSGRPRGAAEVYNVLSAGQSDAAVTVATATSTPGAPAAGEAGDSAPLPRQDGPAFYGMFQTETRRGPVSDAVAKIWRTNMGASTGDVPAAAASYFPHDTNAGGGSARLTAQDVVPPATSPAAIGTNELAAVDPAPAGQAAPNIPLPPARPPQQMLDALVAAQSKTARSNPLDLQAYTKWRRS